MEAANEIEAILENEKRIGENRIIILMLVKPSDENAACIINNFNYWHHASGRCCGIYAIGYSKVKFDESYRDVKTVNGVDNQKWYYSDKSFVEMKQAIQERAEWRYSGEPELILLQSNIESGSKLTFQNKYVIDINYGQSRGYYRSLNTFMESLIEASKSEVEARSAVVKVTKERYSLKTVFEEAVNSSTRLPDLAKKALLDISFILSKKLK